MCQGTKGTTAIIYLGSLGSAAIDTNNPIYFFTYQGAKATTAKKKCITLSPCAVLPNMLTVIFKEMY